MTLEVCQFSQLDLGRSGSFGDPKACEKSNWGNMFQPRSTLNLSEASCPATISCNINFQRTSVWPSDV